ncbi:MAG TPA: recombination mediator RecR [Patescibacteria group bacterium]|nr:recombination mediator RecR [Patescibacteria group bacterium]
MQILPPALVELIESFGILPGVGPRSAERYAYYLVRHDPAQVIKLADSLKNVTNSIKYCPKTFALIPKSDEVSKLYEDPSRDKKIVAVVAEPFDIIAIEKTDHFKGTYHVLGGLIAPIDGITPEELHIKELIKRTKEDKVKEIILALNASVEGESTSLFIQKQLEGLKVKVTRLARGLPIGVDLEYADQLTLIRAIEGRQSLS